MMNGALRTLSSRAAGLGLALAAVVVFASLVQWLPEPESTPRSTTTASVLDASSAVDTHADHGHGDEPCQTDGCHLEAKTMLAAFQKAIETRGAVHRTYGYDAGGSLPILAVADQVNVGLTTKADLAALAERQGLEVVRELPGMNQALLRLPAGADIDAALAALSAEPCVRYAEPDYAARVALTPNDPFLPLMQGRRNAALELAWDLTTGAPGVVVAVLDTGADPTHADLQNRLVPGFDFVNNTAVTSDDNGHGTAMAGIIAAEGMNNEGVVGVAFNSRVMPVKVADAQGVASISDVAAGIDFAIANGARVINLSMGARIGTLALRDAVNRALQAGVVVVASAGNDPVHHEMYPAAYDGVVSCTALGKGAELGFEAVVATGVEAGSPAEDLITTLPGGVYGFVSGSSAAAAYASGVAALVASRAPALSGTDIARILRVARDPIPALSALDTLFRFGRLNARLAVERATTSYIDVAVTDLRFYPAKPVAGQATTAIMEITNEGQVAISNLPVRLQYTLPGGARIEIGFLVANNLLPGEVRELTLNFTAPVAATYPMRAIASSAGGGLETELADNVRPLTVVIDANQEPDLRVVGLEISDPDLAQGLVNVRITVENRGTAPVTNVLVTCDITQVRSLNPPGPAVPPPTAAPVGQQNMAGLAVGQRGTVQLTYTIPNPAPTGVLRLRCRATPRLGETKTADNTAFFELILGRATPLQGLYQQSNGVDLIADAPWRIDPNRPYVPVQIFVPSKGGRSASTKLRLTRTRIEVRDAATGSGTLVYEDAHGAGPTTAVPGIEIVDEMGVVRPALDAFADQELDMNGRHDILRLPRSALGVASAPTAVETKYLDVKIDWEQQRILFFFFQKTRNDSTHTVLRVRFSPETWPQLPGENHYHDVHHHTIAEWYFGSAIDIFAPRKAYGGPLQMVFESAYAMGVIDQPTGFAANGRIISTDHSSFNNRTTPSPDNADHRPPYGPQGPSANPSGMGQLEAYRQVLGITAAEEIAFKQDVPIPKIHPSINNLIDQLVPGIPLGAHMLLYGADHVEGPWHGGGWLKSPGSPNIDVNLFPLLNGLAKNNQATQSEAFTYAAHPFGGMGWRDSNLDRAFGLDPALRSRDEVHDASGEFVVKGVEFFNGRGTRSLPSPVIDFNDLNPWIDPDFATGDPEWDKGIWGGMTIWHEYLSKTLEYAFQSSPDQKFIRKIYQAGGSDAHGDFNFGTGRAATPINLKATFKVTDKTWYGVRTYCFGDGKVGAGPEERWLEAYADGNSVTTDGPLVTFSLDADGRFDSTDLRWHDAVSAATDADGQIGGGGALDGARTALVRRGAATPIYRYRYSSTAEWGPIASVLLYKTEAGNPNPTRNRVSGFLGLGGYEQIVGVNEMPLAGVNAWHEQALDPGREGVITKNTAFALGAYTGGNPDQMDLGPDNYRAYTNPVFCSAYDADVTVTNVDPATGTIPPGGMTVRFAFDISMDPGSYAIELKGLDTNGESNGAATPGFATLGPVTGTGWSDQVGVRDSVLTVTNQTAIPLGGDAYPAGGQVSFVVYWRDAPRDAAGNALNSIALTFSEQQFAGAGTATNPTVGTTTPGATPGTSTTTAVRSSSGGCAISPRSDSPNDWDWIVMVGLGLVLLGARRRA